MTDLDAIRARAANIATGSTYSQQQTATDYQTLLAEIDHRTTDLIAEQNVRQEEWDHASGMLRHAVESVSHWEQQTVAARTQRDRYAALLAEASEALRLVGKAAITVEPTLKKPYPDAPNTSPWERFMERPARRAYNLGHRIRRELNQASKEQP